MKAEDSDEMSEYLHGTVFGLRSVFHAEVFQICFDRFRCTICGCSGAAASDAVPLGETEIRTLEPVTTYIHEGVVFDWQAMLDPPEEYAVIKCIGFEMQEQIAHYMKKNNLKLKEGEQIFDRSQPSFEELVNGEYGSFRFEEMKQ